MARSISIIDYKVAQAEFFLQNIDVEGYDFFAAQCYCDAFVSACRSITFSVQAVCKELDGFGHWYSKEQKGMREDDLLCFFHSYRTMSIHIGDTPVTGGSTNLSNAGKMKLYFSSTPDLPTVPRQDVEAACSEYFGKVLGLVFRLYDRFRCVLDDRWHFTEEHYRELGLTIEDAEEAIGFPRGWTASIGVKEELIERWRMLRSTQAIGPQLQDIFERHLGKTIPGPDDDED